MFDMEWELAFLHQLQDIQNPILDKIMEVLSTLGNAGLFWILVGFALFASKKYRKLGARVLIAMMLTFIVGNLILKNIIHRARPYVVDPSLIPRVTKPSEFSFPSGHTMNGITAALTIFFGDKRIGIAAVILAVLIAVSRMYNLVHFPTDIMGGIVIGICSAMFVEFVLKKKVKRL